MSLPDVARIFFAIDLALKDKELIGDVIRTIKKQATNKPIRWTKTINLHITLQFMKAFHTQELPELLRLVREELAGKKPLSSLTLGPLYLFPNPFMPRVIVLGVNPQNELAELSQSIGRAMQKLSYEPEDRPFNAHLTLGRIKHPNMDVGFLSKLDLGTMPKIAIEAVTLFQSEPQAEGSQYTVIERIEF